MPVVSSYFSKLSYLYSVWVVFHCFVALEKISLMYSTMFSAALIQRSVHRVRDRAICSYLLGQYFAISNVFLDNEEEKS